jgi:hypothetical protein
MFIAQASGENGKKLKVSPGNTKGVSITVPLTSCLTGLDSSVFQIKTKIVSCHTADSKPVKKEVNGTVILPPLLFPAMPILEEVAVCVLTDLYYLIVCNPQWILNYQHRPHPNPHTKYYYYIN